ncbi:pyridoxamine 5'-phosphate oxidase family protein [Candidatus Villigracilis proximus]|uniref:pyridoxamine 5'-phosphate oxidase family protein n=1 Tax=Candidatus Villigracilis proximus TaxID=3140683 RepID=UPI0031E9E289
MPKVSRPKLPKGYVDNPISEVPWEHVETRLTGSTNYWLCTVYPDGRPHVVPRWGALLDGKLYYDGSPETRHARNLEKNQNATLHLESGNDVVIMDGTSHPASKPDLELAQRLSAAYCAKYEADGYAPKPDQWDAGGLYIFTPCQCLAWTTFFEKSYEIYF